MTIEELRQIERSLIESESRDAALAALAEARGVGMSEDESLHDERALIETESRDAALAALAEARGVGMSEDEVLQTESTEGYETKHIVGDVSVSRDVHVGKDAEVNGTLIVHHNTIVDGSISTNNLRAETITVRKLNFLVGEPPIEYVEYSQWKNGAAYFYKSVNYVRNPNAWEVSRVWHYGCLWECRKDLTTSEPRWDSTDWALLMGNTNFSVRFAEPDVIFDPTDFHHTLTIQAFIGNNDVTGEILPNKVTWVRTTWNPDGTQRQLEDDAWAVRRANAGKVLELDETDTDAPLGCVVTLRKMRITATVEYLDGVATAIADL